MKFRKVIIRKNILICIAFGLLVMNIIVFCLINDILKREVQITENRLLLERVKNETGMYRTISRKIMINRKKENMSIKTSLHSLQR